MVPLRSEMTNYQDIIEELYHKLLERKNVGEVADYIPKLGKVDPEKFGICLTDMDNIHYSIGDYDEKFSIQSIAKVLSLCLLYNKKGEEIWQRVDVEPSGTPFNSLVQLEADKGIPRNPFINPGAIVICDMLISEFENPKKELRDYIRRATNSKNIHFNESTAASERSNGFMNIASINFIRSFGNIQNKLDEVLDLYFLLCSIEMTCIEASQAFLFLANEGKCNHTGDTLIIKSRAKRVNAIMLTCGFYDEAGEFAFRVGLPGKSGVGGGIVSILPGEFSIAVWSPRLNSKGNSHRGMKFLEEFTSATSSIF